MQNRHHGQFQRSRHKDNRQDSPVREIREEILKYTDEGLKSLPADKLIEMAQKMGKYLANREVGLKTTQIRKFLDGVKKIDVLSERGKNFNKEQVILLKPKLAYAAGRQAAVKPLMEVLDPAITAGQESYESFKKLIAFIESIVAYHRFHGGKDS